jgi:hypothetical protein
VQPKNGLSAAASGVCFKQGNVEYVFGLDASKGKAVLFRKDSNGTMPIGDASAKVKSGAWYDLKVKVAGDRMVGYVNGEGKLVVNGF